MKKMIEKITARVQLDGHSLRSAEQQPGRMLDAEMTRSLVELLLNDNELPVDITRDTSLMYDQFNITMSFYLVDKTLYDLIASIGGERFWALMTTVSHIISASRLEDLMEEELRKRGIV